MLKKCWIVASIRDISDHAEHCMVDCEIYFRKTNAMSEALCRKNNGIYQVIILNGFEYEEI